MSANLPPLPAGPESNLPVPADGYAVQAYDPAYAAPPSAPSGGSYSVARATSALRRFSWLILGTALVGLAGGIAATRFIDPVYQVNATVFASPSAASGGRSPISEGALTQNAGWRALLRTPAITDPVVRKLSLFLQPEEAKDSSLFAGFTIDPVKQRYYPGQYTLKIENGRYSLIDQLSVINEQGLVGDSIGRAAGFAWVPPARLLGTKARTVKFKVMTLREATADVQSRFNPYIEEGSPVIVLVMRGTAAQRPAATLNAMLEQFVAVASDLKKRELNQQTATLGAQLEAAEAKLRGSEAQLENYRIGAITKPSEGPVVMPGPIAGGQNIQISQPAFDSYFATKTEYEAIHRDRTTLQQLASTVTGRTDSASVNAILSVPAVVRDEGATALRQVIKDYNDKQRDIRTLLEKWTDSTPLVKDAKRDLTELRTQALPQRLNEYVATLAARESVLNRQLGDATRELQEIPSRTIQQGALERERAVNSDLYTKLRASYAEANLAQQSAVPDVKVLDSAVTPLQPSNNTAPRLIGLGLALGLGVGVALAFLLDFFDSRFRYPEQARGELGLDVLGVVPRIDQSGRQQSPEAIAQIVEAFRSIRMNVRYASIGQPTLAFGITSPGPGDGKSLVASNLALSFAEGGWRTVLVDADTRRGQLNTTFDVPVNPGLVEYLEGTALLSDVLYPSRHENLTVVPCGTRHRRAPELLATPRMQQLLAALGSEFDVVIIDTPPLGAGTDAYAIGTACGQLALVLRTNRTNLKMAKAKLATLAQLPVTMLGTILNEVRTDSSMYQYYSYDPEYVMPEETPALTGGTSDRTEVAIRD